METVTKAVSGLGVGAIVGYTTVTVGLCVIGLSAAGPVAGGLFAAKMGAGIAAGSTMAGLQSAAMTGGAYIYGSAVGGVVGSMIPFFSSLTKASSPP